MRPLEFGNVRISRAPIRYSAATTGRLLAAPSLQGEPCVLETNRGLSGQAGDLGGVREQVQNGGLSYLELSFRAVREPPGPQPPTKVTACKDGPHSLGAVLTRSAHFADKTSPFRSRHCIGAVFLGKIN